MTAASSSNCHATLCMIGRHVLYTGFLLALAGCGEQTQQSTTALSPSERGSQVVTSLGCVACHSLDGRRGVGPSWLGIYGTTRTFADGSSAVADDEYLRRSMLEPGAQVVESYDNVMLPAAVNDAQIADIIALITELGTTPAQ
jgi:cytochrome c oxidase subunit II